jgi:DNA invertase Pin-like site-specific DNA recombinase
LTCMAGIAQLEREHIRARIKTGVEAKRRPDGSIPWSKGPKPGTRVKMTTEKEAAMIKLLDEGKSIAEVGRVLGLSRPTLYAWLRRQEAEKGGVK